MRTRSWGSFQPLGTTRAPASVAWQGKGASPSFAGDSYSLKPICFMKVTTS
jgi:hypothetical protein